MGWSCGWDWKPVLVMVAVSLAFAVMNIMVKKAIDDGMNRLVLITLRQLVATLFMAPFAYVLELKNRTKISTQIFMYIFISAMLGTTLTQYCFFVGLQYTSATIACAFLNMVPVMTFLLALPFGLERLNWKSRAGNMKVLGAIVCAAGAVLLTVYKGVTLTSELHHLQAPKLHQAPALHVNTWKSIAGAMALFAACSCWSSWFLVQSKITKLYPALYTCTTVMFFLSSVQVLMLSLATQRRFAVWTLRSKLEIVTVLFSGAVGSGVCLLASSWCIKQKGAVFTSAFSPLTQIIVAGIEVSILGEPLHLGSVLGSIVVIAGLYFLLWGKCKETYNANSRCQGENRGAIDEV